MPDRISHARVSALLVTLAVLAWLPGAAAEWIGEFRPGDGPRLVYTSTPAGTLPEEYLAPGPRLLQRLEQTPPQIDLRGNEIVRPVARYSVDRRGALYELHSPETELPRLAPPEL